MTAHITKTWLEDGKLITQEIPESEIYKREWVGLTDDELCELSASGLALWDLWRAIEAKLKEKNTSGQE